MIPPAVNSPVGRIWATLAGAQGIRYRDQASFPVKGNYTDWTPLTGRPGLFPEDIDTSDPWQFRNVLVR